MKPAIKYSIPFNGDLSLMEDILKTEKIYEIYCVGSQLHDFGFQHDQQPQYILPKTTEYQLFKLAKKYGARINMLINCPLLSYRDLKKEINYIDFLIKRYSNFSAITLADPYQIKFFKNKFPDLEIEASVIMNLDSFPKIEKALKWGITTVNVPLRLNRDIQKLKEISRLKQNYPKFKMKLMVNHNCYYDCLFTAYHYFFAEIESLFRFKPKNDIKFNSECTYFSLEGLNKKELIKKSFIRPEDINYYSQNKVGDVFKILWRHSESSTLKKTILAYVNNDFPGNLFEIVETHEKFLDLYCDNQKFPKDFVQTVTNCDKTNCKKCKYCEKIGDKVIKNIIR